jgi:rhamnogalacturonan endolyase
MAQNNPARIPNYCREIQKEKPGRGLIALNHGDGKVSVSWRYLESDSLHIAFDLYRKDKHGLMRKLNKEPIHKSTYFIDQSGFSGEVTYYLRINGYSNNVAGYKLTPRLAEHPYLSIPMQPVTGDTAWSYRPNDASVGDLDGDGEYELVIKRESNGYDNSHRGVCKGGPLLEAYTLSGDFLWRVDLGINIRQGAHYTPFMVYDFDGDGKAEIAVRTAEGTRFANDKTISDTDRDGISE